jgi:hypothetical protein
MKAALFAAAISLLCLAGAMAANFDDDSVADECTIIRDVTKEAGVSSIQLVNPCQKAPLSKQKPEGVGLPHSAQPRVTD